MGCASTVGVESCSGSTATTVLGPPSPSPSGPQDPYAVPPGQDPVLAEQIAQHLVGRAQELLDAKSYVDAKQLAVEALVESPKGGAADHAKFIIKTVNQAVDYIMENAS